MPPMPGSGQTLSTASLTLKMRPAQLLAAPPLTGIAPMDRWIAEHNIADFREQLATETDPVKREMIRRLLENEEAKLAMLLTDRPKPFPPSDANALDGH
jgi:hypothetical protein